MTTAAALGFPTGRSLAGGRQAHLLHVLPSFGVGGLEVRLARLVSRLGPAYRHTIIPLDGRDDCAERIARTACFGVLPLPRGRGGLPGNVARWRGVLANLRPDLLLTYNWGAIEWALANAFAPLCPHLHGEDGFGPDEASRPLARRNALRRLALRRALRLVVPSRTLAEIARRHWRLSPERILHLANGIDLGRFSRPPDEARLPGPPRAAGELVVGAMGPLRPEKNYARLIEAFAAVAAAFPVRLVIVGDGIERGRLERLAAARDPGGRIFFTGRLAEPETILGLFDVYVVSSDTEQMPISLIEAMAAGLPVAATDVGDVRDMLPTPNRPFVVPRHEEGALAAALSRLLGDAGLRRELGERNRTEARARFDEERMFAAYDRLYRDALAGLARGDGPAAMAG